MISFKQTKDRYVSKHELSDEIVIYFSYGPTVSDIYFFLSFKNGLVSRNYTDLFQLLIDFKFGIDVLREGEYADTVYYNGDSLTDLISGFPKIKHSAIMKDGIIYIGNRHHDCFRVMHECGVSKEDSIQGFVDENGMFHNRKQALTIAEYHDQIKKKHYPLDELMSEDCW